MHGMMKITKKKLHDKKTKNILSSSLGINGFLRVSNFQTTKEIWDALQVTHKGIDEVKQIQTK